MGTLESHASRPQIEIDDVTLAHLKIIIGTKLRRQESFMMTWLPDRENPVGRLTAWVHPSIPLILAFENATMPKIDGKRITRMMEGLNSHGELVIDDLE